MESEVPGASVPIASSPPGWGMPSGPQSAPSMCGARSLLCTGSTAAATGGFSPVSLASLGPGRQLGCSPIVPPSLHNGPQNAWMEPHLFPGLCLCPLPPSPLPCPKVSGQTSEKPGHSLGWPPGGQPPRKPQGRAAGEGAWGRTTTLVPAATGRTSGCRASGSPSKDGSIQLAGLVPRGFTLTLSTPRMCEEIKTLVANLTNISECTVFSYSLLGSLVK